VNVLFELSDSGVLRFDGSSCWASVHGRSGVFLPELKRVSSLGRHRRAGDATAVPARQEVVEEYVPVGDVGRHDGSREEDEGEYRFPEIDAFRRGDGDDDVEPQVGEDAPRGGDEEDAQVLDPAHLAVRDHRHAQSDDNEQVERCAADDRARTEVARLEPVADHLDDRQHDLRRGRTESH